jgi:hypothetical protein
MRQEPKKLTSQTLKTDKNGIAKPPVKSRTARKNQRAVELTQQTVQTNTDKRKLPASKKGPSNRQGSRTTMEKQRDKKKQDQEERNLPVRLNKKEGVPMLGIPKSAKPNSQLREKKQSKGGAN